MTDDLAHLTGADLAELHPDLGERLDAAVELAAARGGYPLAPSVRRSFLTLLLLRNVAWSGSLPAEHPVARTAREAFPDPGADVWAALLLADGGRAALQVTGSREVVEP